MIVNDSAFGYPVRKLSSVKPGEYFVQALLHKDETFQRSDGHTARLPMDRGEGQQWNRTPGNLYSKPAKLALKDGGHFSIELTEEFPPIPEPKYAKYIRHVRIQSERLTKFWGRPMHLATHVLVPKGIEEAHPAGADLKSWRY